MNKKTKLEILYDHNVKGLSYRTLAKKYGISCTGAHRVVMSRQEKREKPKEVNQVAETTPALPDDIKALKEEVRLLRLKIELQDLMLDISSKELGIDRRKKHGTRRSK
jgi:hypothetical protein